MKSLRQMWNKKQTLQANSIEDKPVEGSSNSEASQTTEDVLKTYFAELEVNSLESKSVWVLDSRATCNLELLRAAPLLTVKEFGPGKC